MTFSSCSMFGLGVFSSYQDAEIALLKLRRSYFPTDQVSFLAKCTDSNDTSFPLQSVRYIGLMPSTNPVSSDMLSSLNGLVNDLKQIALSLNDSVVAGGRIGSMLSSCKAFGGSILQALQALGVPEDVAILYCDRINRGDCLVGVESPDGNFLEADKILHHSLISRWQVYQFFIDGSDWNGG